jgi:tetratricopeptide (TPR) repeat protein
MYLASPVLKRSKILDRQPAFCLGGPLLIPLRHENMSGRLWPIQAQLKAHDVDAAWQSYEESSSAAGGNLPAAPWLELIRQLENQQNFDRAVAESDRLAQAYPQGRPSLLALLTAGRLALKKLNRPDEALRFYKTADASPVPHLDWESNIRAGMTDAELAIRAPAPARL